MKVLFLFHFYRVYSIPVFYKINFGDFLANETPSLYHLTRTADFGIHGAILKRDDDTVQKELWGWGGGGGG